MEQKKQKAQYGIFALDLTLSAMFTALTAVLSQLAIPIGPVPISCSLIAVYLTGILLTPKLAFLSQTVYLLLGAAGVPVFSNFGAGIAKLAGPTGGYLLVYPILALWIALCMRGYDKKRLSGQGKGKSFGAAVRLAVFLTAVLLTALLLCYAAGTAWFMLYSGAAFRKVLALTVTPFLVGDGVKILLCTLLSVSLRPLFLKMRKKYSA